MPNCTLTIPHAQVQCVAIPGVGTNLVWQITVLGQSAVSAQSVSYYPPLLNASVPASLSTDGGIIVLNGQDFGYDASQIALTVNGVNIPSITLTVSDMCLLAIAPYECVRVMWCAGAAYTDHFPTRTHRWEGVSGGASHCWRPTIQCVDATRAAPTAGGCGHL